MRVMHRILGCLFLGAGLLPVRPLSAQNLLPNPGFEAGKEAPAEWRLENGVGEWSREARQGERCLMVRGDGKDSSYWRSPRLPLPPGLYQLSFNARRGESASGGSAVTGPSRVNRDFGLEPSWQPYSYVFCAPEDGGEDYVRFGHWQVTGNVYFDEVRLNRVLVSHTRLPNDATLGEAESIRGGIYRFRPDLNWRGANYHRPLAKNRAGFNSNRWLFYPGAEVVYRQNAAGGRQKSARVRVQINYHTGGELKVEAGRDGKNWTTVATANGERRGGWSDLPASLFPAGEIWIRLSQAGQGSGFQVDSYEYEAALDQPAPEVDGKTYFLELAAANPKLAVGLKAIQPLETQGRCDVQLALTNLTGQALHLRANVLVDSKTNAAAERKSLQLAPDQSVSLALSAEVSEPGPHQIRVDLEDEQGRVLFSGSTEMRTGFLSDARYGHWLKGSEGLGLWWCESGWKVGRERALPRPPAGGAPEPVAVSAARGEFEAAQVVLRPEQDGQLIAARFRPFRRGAEEGAAISAVIHEVAYVQVTRPTDDSCLPGWYPDPLPSLKTPLLLRAGQNQPLWVTVKVATNAPAGDYQGELELQTTLGNATVPLKVRVYDFALPRQTHLKSALGLSAGLINRYHHLRDPRQQRLIYEKYLQNFAEHRITPYRFDDSAPIDIRFEGQGADKKARVDFTRFDEAARRWLDEGGFTTVQIPLRGMGGGTFQSRHLGELEGFKEGTPEHAKLFQDYLSQIERHLREQGWLDKAYTYWFDEPDPKDYEFVTAGMKRIKAAAPGIKRMLTEQPEPALMGQVEIWCALTPEWTLEKVRARRTAGEEVWWYICTAPKAPYVTEFIDHPGTELRLWPWQSWQYDVQAMLVWESTYWTSPLVYPEPKVQDPWTDAMSWVSGYDNPVGFTSPWGNGDGRFIYPPRPSPEQAGAPILEGPVNSLRWENLRDGIEDYEYFWLLQQQIKRAQDRPEAAGLVAEARALLRVPAEVSRDLTHFTTDPRSMLAHRERLARMIERLGKDAK